LGWGDLAHVTFKNRVARNSELGHYAPTGRKRGGNQASFKVDGPLPGMLGAGDHSNGANNSSGSGSGGSAEEAHSSNGALHTAGGAPNGTDGSAAAIAPRQPCPLASKPQSASEPPPKIILAEDLASTLSHVNSGRVMPGVALSSYRSSGSCLHKWKMGVNS
jgi:hypothetical protein